MAQTKASTRNVLRLALVILIILVGVLAYVYYLVTRPPIEIFESENFVHLQTIYGYGPAPDEQLKEPHDVVFDRKGNIYVTDTGHRRVLVFDPNGRLLRTLGRQGTGRGEFVTPLGIAVGEDGRVYVADQPAGKVVIFSPRGKVLKEVRIMMPMKPYILGNRLYVINYAFVNIYDLGGRFIDRWGGKGKEKGRFDLPVGLALIGKDNIFVTEAGNLRLQSLDDKGRVKWAVGQPSAGEYAERSFGLPAGIASDENKRLYVIDAFNHELAVFDDRGQRLATLSRQGQKEGELYYPAGISYGGRGIFAIADKFNNRVQLVRISLD